FTEKRDARTRFPFLFPILPPLCWTTPPPPPTFSSFSEDEGRKNIASGGCTVVPSTRPAVATGLCAAPSYFSSTRATVDGAALSDAYRASSRGCTGAPIRQRRSRRPLLPRHGPAHRRRGPARRRLHCSELLRPTAAGAMEK
uniref:Uncharacterized protein n=1 Tax=Aegilops tauschii subsp. strangulata TaxID=200361 RepID=A0A453K4B3_AEGTS